jgi:hypothetical protein
MTLIGVVQEEAREMENSLMQIRRTSSGRAYPIPSPFIMKVGPLAQGRRAWPATRMPSRPLPSVKGVTTHQAAVGESVLLRLVRLLGP